MTIKQTILYLIQRFKMNHSKKQETQLENIWLGTYQHDVPFEKVDVYHQEKTKYHKIQSIDNTTWSDLNMELVFQKLNRCTSVAGRQYLYHLLHCNEIDTKIFSNSESAYLRFIQDITLRKKIQKQLKVFNQFNGYQLIKLFVSDLPNKPKGYPFIYLLSLTLLFSLIGTLYNPNFIFAVLGIALINIIIHKIYILKITEFIPDMNSLNCMLYVASNLAKIKTSAPLIQIQNIQSKNKMIDEINKKTAWLLIDPSKVHELFASLIEYLNCFFLLNIITFLNSITTIKKYQQDLLFIFESIGSLDATIAISGCLNSANTYCVPQFNKGGKIKFEDIYHPLIQEPVSNSLQLENQSCLVTGSNMAGKTTFIKTIGINLILARNLQICFASSANIPKVIVRASIKRQDDLNQSKSYYYKEIEAILQFIQNSKNQENLYCFLIDEIFRGTNTLERLSISKAVLEYLGNNNFTFVTTHDIELQNMLNEKFQIYHFNAQIKNNSHFFDYKLKPGSCSTRNAIELLKLKGYPDTIIQTALNESVQLSK